jgi:hypothetical protein
MSDVEPRLILYFPTSNASYEVEPSEEILAGLSDLCDINLRRFFGGPRIHTVSRVHFKLIYHEGSGYVIVDLFSASGTRVNNHQLPPGVQYLLRNGDFIMLAGNEDFVISVVTDVSKATEVFGDIQPSGIHAAHSREAIGLRYMHGLDQFVVNGVSVPHSQLSPLEHNLLRHLYNRAGRVCSYDELAIQVWGYKPYDALQNNTIAKTVSNLRKKLDGLSTGSGEKYIVTVHGRGVKCLLLPE